jgi:tape measure domain-containing protein
MAERSLNFPLIGRDRVSDTLSKIERRFGQFDRRLSQVQRRMDHGQRSTMRFSASMGSLGGVATRAVGGATVALGGLAAAGAILGVKTAANLETAEVAFTQLLGSGKRARAFLGELKTFAARTPFELPGLVDAARSLVGAGTAAKDVIPILTSLGDASGALGLDQERFGRVMLAVTQIMNRGRVQAEELNQITEAGIPVWTLLAKATGKPIPELQKLMQSGKLLSKDVLPALFAQMRKDYGGGMAKQAKTLNGIWSTFKDTVSLTLADALEPLVPVIKTVLPEASRAFQRGFEGISDFFRKDLGPELGRVKQAWDDNKGAILGLAGTLTGTQSQFGANKDAAASLADTLTALTEGAGDASRFLTSLGNGLNSVESGSQGAASSINNRLRPAWQWFTENTAIGTGAMRLYRGVLGDVKADLADVGVKLGQSAVATGTATTAGYRHVDALRAEKLALDALKGALQGEESAELDVRQAKINVASAQARLTELTKGGRKGSLLYQQAQIDLRRAQIELKAKTDAYKSAQDKANAATRGAMSASQRAQGPLSRLGQTAEAAGKKVIRMGLDARRGINLIPNRRVAVTANYNTTAPKGIELLIEKGLVGRARGGGVWGQGTTTSDSIPAMLSNEEHVFEADAVKGAGGGSFARGHRALEGLRSLLRASGGAIRGFATGGPVLNFQQRGGSELLARPGRFDRNIARSLDLAARGFGILVRQNRDAIFGMGSPAIKAFIRSTDRLPYRWGAAGPGSYDCSGLVSAVLGKHTGAGGGHGQRYFTTSTIHSGILGIKPGLGGTLQIGVTAGTGHMAGRYGGLGFEAESTRTGIKTGSAASRPESFARHFHLAKGGRVTLEELLASGKRLDIGGDAGRLRIREFDGGGWLMPGQVGVNHTPKPERVVGPAETMTVNLATPTRRALARDIADALVAAGVGATYLDSRRAEQLLAGAGLSNSRRR